MRILLWYWGRRGAGGQLTLALAEALARRPDAAIALSLSRQADLRPEIEALGLPCETVATYAGAGGFLLGTLRVPLLARRLVAQARDFQADAVVSVMTHLWTPLVAPALAQAGIPFVPLVHDAHPHPGDHGLFWDWRLGRELEAARLAIALSEAVAAALRARRPELPVARLPLGAHLPAALLRAAPAGGGGTAPEFLLFGRLRAYKGLDLLRDAFRLLREQHPEARLRVVGEGDAEALAPGLTALPGVRVEPRWVAEAEIPGLIAAADALVLPYREASQSGVVSLAFALGVPVVATPVGGLAEQVTEGVNGALATAAEPAALAAAMARLCDPAARARLAAGARETGRALADWDAQAAALLAALRAAGIGG
ncbi:glycosyltransferase family 4 protein [Siccirubricoccus sp. G192]|uniref:glycosyltransferase family 4 protein n=1 Tax=Siccirubricoccus sp. G192 TaxID=2849651 RepID=UPI001C2BA526|nr:glycosyltransferase [Siccirubricoccus sp. G192]MBV1795910.1 glycosyltransferase [Siccirubricoccus sp. G192]